MEMDRRDLLIGLAALAAATAAQGQGGQKLPETMAVPAPPGSPGDPGVRCRLCTAAPGATRHCPRRERRGEPTINHVRSVS